MVEYWQGVNSQLVGTGKVLAAHSSLDEVITGFLDVGSHGEGSHGEGSQGDGSQGDGSQGEGTLASYQ